MNITIDGYNIDYKITGDGDKTAVILQGWGTEYKVYDSVAYCISSCYRVVQFDFPGFGHSDEPRQPWAVTDYAEFFVKFLDALHIKSVTLIGHSYGGRVIIKLAGSMKVPFEIERIVLIDSAGVLPKKTLKQKIKVKKYKILKKLVSFKPIYAICPNVIEDWKNKQGSADYRNATPIMRQCLVKAVNEDLTSLFADMHQEVLLIWGDQDTATPISDAKLMEERMPNAGLAVIKGAGHFCFLEQPVIFANIMRSYFKL